LKKVVGRNEGGDDDGGDKPDLDDGEDLGIEEIDPNDDGKERKSAGSESGDKSKEKQNSGNFTTPSGGKEVLDWASLFQNREESMLMEKSELAHYSCTKLMREMEAAEESESEEENDLGEGDDGELVKLPEKLLEIAMEIDSGQGLPDNLYEIPDRMEISDKNENLQNKMSLDSRGQLGNGEKWGPVLVEKRISRRTQGGKPVLEKAWERKKLVNLESGKGNSKSYLSAHTLSKSEINDVAREVGVCLGKEQKDVDNAISMIQDSDLGRAEVFSRECDACVHEGKK
jgi:hypothetical protein